MNIRTKHIINIIFGLILISFMTIVGYLMPNPLLCLKQFFSKQFSLA